MTDALQMLREDHRQVKDLFKQFEDADDTRSKGKIVDAALTALELHAELEEEIFYPAVRKEADSVADEMDEAEEEHHVVKLLIRELRAMKPSAPKYDAKFTVLAENVKHHIDEEESEMLPKAAELGMQRMNDLGAEMEARKQQLASGTGRRRKPRAAAASGKCREPVAARHRVPPQCARGIDQPRRRERQRDRRRRVRERRAARAGRSGPAPLGGSRLCNWRQRMGILAWIIVGLVGGAVAQLLVKDDPIGGGPVGLVVTVLVGIVGAVLAGFIAVALGISNGVDDFDIGTIVLSIVGAVLILLIWKALARGNGPLRHI